MTASPVALRVVPNEWLMTSPVGLYSVCSQTISPNGFGGGTLTSVRQPFIQSRIAVVVTPSLGSIVRHSVNVDRSLMSMPRLARYSTQVAKGRPDAIGPAIVCAIAPGPRIIVDEDTG
jgi:hypothetical protein